MSVNDMVCENIVFTDKYCKNVHAMAAAISTKDTPLLYLLVLS